MYLKIRFCSVVVFGRGHAWHCSLVREGPLYISIKNQFNIDLAHVSACNSIGHLSMQVRAGQNMTFALCRESNIHIVSNTYSSMFVAVLVWTNAGDWRTFSNSIVLSHRCILWETTLDIIYVGRMHTAAGWPEFGLGTNTYRFRHKTLLNFNIFISRKNGQSSSDQVQCM